MVQAFIMVLREGFESFLIVAIILSYLRAIGQNRLLPPVYFGIGVSVAVSGLLGLVLLKGINQSFWEGVLGLVTIVMVGTLIIQMWRIGPRLKADIQGRLQGISSKKTKWAGWLGIFFFTMVMVTREGMETALMLLQVRDTGVMTGILLGLTAAILISWAWLRTGNRLNLKRFFQVTGFYLLLFMVQVGIYSFHEFSESGLFPNSEAIHLATEPFSPVGIYGQWFSVAMISVCALWLLAGWLRDRSLFVVKK